MGFASGKYKRKSDERPRGVNPIWRGIGCIFILLMPILAWAGAELFMQTNRWLTLPPVLYQQVAIKLTSWEPINLILSAIDNLLSTMRLTYGTIFFTLVFLLVGYGLMSVIYGIIYRIVGPPRYTNVDARPITVRRRRR